MIYMYVCMNVCMYVDSVSAVGHLFTYIIITGFDQNKCCSATSFMAASFIPAL